jgi:hypothetical protein
MRVVKTEVKIPFKSDMKKLVLAGKKTCTSRTRKYGKSGDTFTVNKVTFVITKVRRMPISEVFNKYYKHEGFSTPDECKNYFIKLGLACDDDNEILWVHFFKRIDKKITPKQVTTLDAFQKEVKE